MADDLLPCPFCGGPAEVVLEGPRKSKTKFIDVACYNTNCMVQPCALGFPEKTGIESWNSRATPSDAAVRAAAEEIMNHEFSDDLVTGRLVTGHDIINAYAAIITKHLGSRTGEEK